MPPVNTHLNLPDYYYHTLRMETLKQMEAQEQMGAQKQMETQKQMDKKEKKEVMLELRALQESRGSVIDDRLEVLSMYVSGGLQALKQPGVQSTSWTKLM
mmetsp:Transcript_9572/g.30657  ORF Transcript_9572/g.30657 Transcript_9572/m.30657 type:complete len:100 (+) Transcript_9572:265-564(+)